MTKNSFIYLSCMPHSVKSKEVVFSDVKLRSEILKSRLKQNFVSVRINWLLITFSSFQHSI